MTRERERPAGGQLYGAKKLGDGGFTADSTAARRSPFDLDRFTYRHVREAMNEATAAYWRRRAALFDAAAPRSGDFTGRASRADLVALDRRVRAKAQACRNRAELCELTPEEERLILDCIASLIESGREVAV